MRRAEGTANGAALSAGLTSNMQRVRKLPNRARKALPSAQHLPHDVGKQFVWNADKKSPRLTTASGG